MKLLYRLEFSLDLQSIDSLDQDNALILGSSDRGEAVLMLDISRPSHEAGDSRDSLGTPLEEWFRQCSFSAP